MKQYSSYYTGEKGKEYFAFRQKRRNPVMQKLNAEFIYPYLGDVSAGTVVDFGCGTGEILSNMDVKNKVGIEISEEAQAQARKNGLVVYADAKKIEGINAVAAFSYHAIEHVPYPLEALGDMHSALNSGAQVVVVVPCENPHDKANRAWRPKEKNHHLHSWTPLSMGNLMEEAGFSIKEAYIRPTGYAEAILFLHKCPPLFYLVRRFLAYIRNRYEVVIVAEK